MFAGRIVVGAAVLAVAAAALIAAGPPVGMAAPTPVDRPTPFAARCNGASVAPALADREVWPVLAADTSRPGRLIAAWVQDPAVDSDLGRGIVTARSDDGGASWSSAGTPAISRCSGMNGGGGRYRYAAGPSLSIGPDGRAYLLAQGRDALFEGLFDATPRFAGVVVTTSTDGGASWERPHRLSRQRLLVTDLVAGAVSAHPQRAGTAYAIWGLASAQGVAGWLVFARTTDGGATWEAPREILRTPARAFPGRPLVLADGTILFVFADPDLSRVGAVRSTDAGRTWLSQEIARVRRPRPSARVLQAPPDAAVDSTGAVVYAVWVGGDASRNPAVYLGRSHDAGASWNRPVRVGGLRGAMAFDPRVVVLADGTVLVSYLEVRDGIATLRSVRSSDRGATFGNRRQELPGAAVLDQSREFAAPARGHALVAVGAGAHVLAVTLDPRDSERTRVVAGRTGRVSR